MRFQDVRNSIDAGDRNGVANEIEFEIVVQGRVDRATRTDYEQRVAVRWRTHDRLGADIAARSRAVVNDELLAQPLRQPLTNDAPDDVDLATGLERHDQPHKLNRIGLRLCDSRHHRQRGSARYQMQEISAGKFHFDPPSLSVYSITSSARASSVGGTSRPS